MRKLKYFTVLMLVGLLTLTGCSINFGGSDSAKGTAEERLEKALIKLANADSFTVKASMEGEIEDQDVAVDFIIKLAKDNKYYNVYLDIESSADSSDDSFEIEGYLLTSKKAVELYLNLNDEWGHIKIDNDDVEDTTKIDVDKYATGLDEKDVKKGIKNLKSVKFGKTKNGLTEIIVIVDKDEMDGLGTQVTKDVEMSVYVDSKNNIKKVVLDPSSIPGYEGIDDAKFTIEISDINETKVSVPKNVKNNAEDIEVEELLGAIFGLLGFGGNIDDPEPIPTPVDGDKILSCSLVEEGVSEEVSVAFKDDKIAGATIKMILSSEEEAKQYYELIKAFSEDEYKVELSGKTIILSGDSLIEDMDDMTIEDMKSQFETEGATCTIK